jgi:hypothetical protein
MTQMDADIQGCIELLMRCMGLFREAVYRGSMERRIPGGIPGVRALIGENLATLCVG